MKEAVGEGKNVSVLVAVTVDVGVIVAEDVGEAVADDVAVELGVDETEELWVEETVGVSDGVGVSVSLKYGCVGDTLMGRVQETDINSPKTSHIEKANFFIFRHTFLIKNI